CSRNFSASDSLAVLPNKQRLPGCVDPRAAVIYLGMGVFGYASDTCLRLGRAHSMTKKQILLYGLAAVVLAVLVYMQFRTWRNFDWPTFWKIGRASCRERV